MRLGTHARDSHEARATMMVHVDQSEGETRKRQKRAIPRPKGARASSCTDARGDGSRGRERQGGGGVCACVSGRARAPHPPTEHHLVPIDRPLSFPLSPRTPLLPRTEQREVCGVREPSRERTRAERRTHTLSRLGTPGQAKQRRPANLVDPASSHMLRSRAKPCMSQRTWISTVGL